MSTEQTSSDALDGRAASFASRLRMPTAVSRLPRVLTRANVAQKEPAKPVKTIGEASAAPDKADAGLSASANYEVAKLPVKKGYVENRVGSFNELAKASVSHASPAVVSSVPAANTNKSRLQQPGTGLRGGVPGTVTRKMPVMSQSSAKFSSPPSQSHGKSSTSPSESLAKSSCLPSHSVLKATVPKPKQIPVNSQQATMSSSVDPIKKLKESTSLDEGLPTQLDVDSDCTLKRASSLRVPRTTASRSLTAPSVTPGSKGISSIRRPESFKERSGIGARESANVQPSKISPLQGNVAAGQLSKPTSQLASPARTPSPSQSTSATQNGSIGRATVPQVNRPLGLKKPPSYSSAPTTPKFSSTTKVQSLGENGVNKPAGSSSIPNRRQLFTSKNVSSSQRGLPSSNTPSPTSLPAGTTVNVSPSPPPASTAATTSPSPPPASTARTASRTQSPASTAITVSPSPPPASTAITASPSPPPANAATTASLNQLNRQRLSVLPQSGEEDASSVISPQKQSRAVAVSSEPIRKTSKCRLLSYSTQLPAKQTARHTFPASSGESMTVLGHETSESNTSPVLSEDFVDGQSTSRLVLSDKGSVSSLISRSAQLPRHAPMLPEDQGGGHLKPETLSTSDELTTSTMNGVGSENEDDNLPFDVEEAVVVNDIISEDTAMLQMSIGADDGKIGEKSAQRRSMILPLEDISGRKEVDKHVPFSASKGIAVPSTSSCRARSLSASSSDGDSEIVLNSKEHAGMPTSRFKMPLPVPEVAVGGMLSSMEHLHLIGTPRPASPGKSSRNMAVRVSARKSLNSPYSQGAYRTYSMPGDSILMTQPTPTATPPGSPLRSPTSVFTPTDYLSSSLPTFQPATTPQGKISSPSAKQSHLQHPSSYFRHAVSMAQRRSSGSQAAPARELFYEHGLPGGKSGGKSGGSVVVISADTYRQMQTDIKTLKALLFQLKRCLHDNDGTGIAMAITPHTPPRQALGEDVSASATILSLQRELEEKDHKISAMQHQLEIWQAQAAGTP